MKIAKLEIQDTFGTSAVSFDPGTVTRIRGKNESGKSSIIKALMYVFDGGSDPGVIRNGAKKSTIKLTLDNGVSITKSTTASGSRLEIVDSNGLIVASPQRYIQGLADSLQINPGRLLTIDAATAAGKKALMQALLETMPISFFHDDILSAAPVTETDGEPQPGYTEAAGIVCGAMGDSSDLDGMAKIRKQVEDSRRAVGVQAKEAEGRASGLAASITNDEDVTEARERAAWIERETREIAEAVAIETDGLREDFAAEERAIRAEMQAKLDAMQERRSETLITLNYDAAQKANPLHEELAALRERLKAAERQGFLKQQAAKERAAWQEHQGRYDIFTKALQLIDAARKGKLANLPIPGVTFDGGDVLVGGVRWQDVNLASRVSVAVQNATLGKGKLDLILWDDGEHLDKDTDAALVEALTEAGYQVMTCHVTDGEPLTITTEGN